MTETTILLPDSDLEGRASGLLVRARARDMNPDYDSILAALREVERHAGPAVATETFLNRRPLPEVLSLSRALDIDAWERSRVIQSPAVAPTITVRERRSAWDDLALLEVDTEWRPIDAWRLQRLGYSCWGTHVVVTYRAQVDVTLRDQIALDLVSLGAAFSGYESEQLGDWRGSQGDRQARRQALLDRLTEGRPVAAVA